jgi:hypothetical protein
LPAAARTVFSFFFSIWFFERTIVRHERSNGLIKSALILVILFPIVLAGNYAGDVDDGGDIDAFMAKVLAKRDSNREALRGYLFSERELLEIKGIELPAYERMEREYLWVEREGYLVRSPVRVNGVAVSREEQQAAEREWLEKARKRRQEGLDQEAFFGFEFQPGRYLYAGKQGLQGREVVAVDYFPKMDRKRAASKRRKARQEYFDRMFEKTLQVNMLILPEEHQIVKITFDNLGLDFLPFRWLVRFEGLTGSMLMDKPLGDVWLPKEIQAEGRVSTADGALSIRYSKDFFDYHKADVKIKLHYGGAGQEE